MERLARGRSRVGGDETEENERKKRRELIRVRARVSSNVVSHDLREAKTVPSRFLCHLIEHAEPHGRVQKEGRRGWLEDGGEQDRGTGGWTEGR